MSLLINMEHNHYDDTDDYYDDTDDYYDDDSDTLIMDLSDICDKSDDSEEWTVTLATTHLLNPLVSGSTCHTLVNHFS